MTEKTCYTNIALNLAFTLNGEVIVSDGQGKILPRLDPARVFPFATEKVLRTSAVSLVTTVGSPVKICGVIDGQAFCTIAHVDDATGQVTHYTPC